MDLTERTTTHDGLAHRWLEGGDGPVTVVLVHGIPTSPELWRHVAPRITGARVLAWEMPGYGRAWRLGEDRDISVGAQADHLRAWMDAVAIERAVLAGHDLGGGVVQIAAVRAPGRCAGLVVTNGIAYDSWPIPEVKAIRAAGAVVQRLPRAALKALFGVLIAGGHDDRARGRESLALHLRGYDHRDGGRVLIRQMRSLDPRDTQQIAPALPGLGVPAALAWGMADRFQKPGFGRRLAADLGAPLEEIEGGRHFTPEDHPGPVAAAVQSVVDRVAATVTARRGARAPRAAPVTGYGAAVDQDLEALVERLLAVEVSALCDADKSLPVVDREIRAMVPDVRFAGPALTVVAEDDHLPVLSALERAREGDVLVVAGNGHRKAVLGELFATEARRRGLAGVVIDGFCRDVSGLRRVGLPVFARGTLPMSGTTTSRAPIGAPVSCGGVEVTPGAIVFGDDDGVVIASPEQVRAALDGAEAIGRAERAMLERMAGGTPLAALTTWAEHVVRLDAGEDSALAFRVDG